MAKKEIQNTADLRSQNKKKILQALRTQGGLTKNQIMAETGLSLATVVNILNEMMEAGWIRLGGFSSSTGGRMPLLFTTAPDGCYFLVINFAIHREIRAALVSIDSQVQKAIVLDYGADTSYQDLLARLKVGVNQLLEEAGVSRSQILGSTAAVPAIFDHTTRLVINSTIPLLNDQPLGQDLREVLKLDVFIENDANLMALACHHMAFPGAAPEGVLFLYVGEGLGVGVVVDGHVISGSHGYGGEISHIPMGRAGYLCPCGNRNCIETELSLPGFLRKYRDRSPQNPISTDLPLNVQWDAYVERCREEDTDALAVAEESGELLGSLVALLVNLLDPETIMIGGCVDQIADLLQPVTERQLNANLVVKRKGGLPVQFVTGYNRLILRGCGELAFLRWQP